MSAVPLVLCDPDRSPFWPLAETRPVAELLAVTSSFRQRWEVHAGPVAMICCDAAVIGCAFHSNERPRLNSWPETAGGLRVAITSWVPPRDWRFGAEMAEYRIGDRPVAWRLDPTLAREAADLDDGPAALVEWLSARNLSTEEVGGRVFDSLWAIVEANGELINHDAEGFTTAETVTGVDPVALLGDGLKVQRDVTIGPFVALDTEPGPIVLGAGVRVAPHTLLEGPLYVGPGSVILGGRVGRGTSIGAGCRIRGEVEASIVHPFSNKAHDGFVGHSVLGAWVNLGAGTTTSDLKNTYGPIRLTGADGVTDTGVLKLGAFLGDHVKTGIGSLLTTGARFGVGTHFFGGRQVSPTFLPSFCWFDGDEQQVVRLEPFLRTVEKVMGRRDQVLTQDERAMLEALHRLGTTPL
ncbi:MAG: hypothetical protein P8Y29_04135 [Gemmatimonadota bacterium]